MRYFLNISFDGTRYNGWQIQPDAPTIQAELQAALSLLLRGPIATVGAGRTDSGVHATDYTVHFDASPPVPEPDAFLLRLNKVLPPDIAAHRLQKVRLDAHARYSAVERRYEYRIIYRKDPFRERTAWLWRHELDIEKMNAAAQMLLRTRDFTTFAKLGSGNRTNICRVNAARWEEQNEGIVFRIAADRFLRNMVRAIVGTLVDVGRGKLSPEDFGRITAARDLSLSSTSAPAHGLFFSGAVYPKETYATADPAEVKQ